MFEYIFFEKSMAEKFIEQIAKFNLQPQIEQDSMGGWLVLLDESHLQDFSEDIEIIYDELLDEQRSIEEGDLDDSGQVAAGVRVLLRSGESCNVSLPPSWVAKLLTVLTLEEYRDLVQEIALQVENPSDHPICHVIRKF
jgi:hypothetical protein